MLRFLQVRSLIYVTDRRRSIMILCKQVELVGVDMQG